MAENSSHSKKVTLEIPNEAYEQLSSLCVFYKQDVKQIIGIIFKAIGGEHRYLIYLSSLACRQILKEHCTKPLGFYINEVDQEALHKLKQVAKNHDFEMSKGFEYVDELNVEIEEGEELNAESIRTELSFMNSRIPLYCMEKQ